MDDRRRGEQDPSIECLARWQASGDRAALEELLALEINSLKSRLRARAGHMTDPSASVSDVAQEAVLRMLLLETPPQFENPAALRAYLWISAWRLLAERLRRSKLSIARLDDVQSKALDAALASTGGMGVVEATDRSAALAVALNLLAAEESEILSLVYYRNLRIDEAAQELGISRDAANGRLVRARRELARKLLNWSQVIG